MENRAEIERSVLMAQTAEGTVTLPVDTILYIEGAGRYQKIYCSDSEMPITICSSMQKLEEQLSEKGFMRIHKGYLVNYKFIRRQKDMDAVLTDPCFLKLFPTPYSLIDRTTKKELPV